MEVTGKIKWIDEVKTYGNNGFRKREVVLITEEQYPQTILIEFVQDKCELLDSFLENENVRISINLRGREWINPEGETKYFNSIQGWRIDKIELEKQDVPPIPSSEEVFKLTDENDEEVEDDLPF
tara:strand:+ start:1562 stop:1936 length:375 start_codon:yes stop_codon:yes gene_type:complete